MIYTLNFRRRFLGRFLPPKAGEFSHNGRTVPMREVQRHLDGRRVCLLICGYNSSSAGAQASYERIVKGLDSVGVTYDDYVFVQWPTSTGPGYWAAESKVYWDGFIPGVKWWEGMGNRLRDVLKVLPYAFLDAIAHSLGNGVILDALRDGDVAGVRNLILTNPAVAADSISVGGDFARSITSISGKAMVFYSRRDSVLEKAFRASKLFTKYALGYSGPSGGVTGHTNVVAIDATPWCASHSGCRDAAEYYLHIRNVT